MKCSYMLAWTIALSIGCAMAQESLRGVTDPAPRQILIANDSASRKTSGHAAPIPHRRRQRQRAGWLRVAAALWTNPASHCPHTRGTLECS